MEEKQIDEEKNKKHIEKIYTEQATKLIKACLWLFIFDSLTYIYGLYLDKFDFGFIFEFISFIFLLIALNKLRKKDYLATKRNILIAIFPLCWIILYDLIKTFISFEEAVSVIVQFYIYYDAFVATFFTFFYACDGVCLIVLLLLLKTYNSLNKADGNIKSKNFTDSFYDSL